MIVTEPNRTIAAPNTHTAEEDHPNHDPGRATAYVLFVPADKNQENTPDADKHRRCSDRHNDSCWGELPYKCKGVEGIPLTEATATSTLLNTYGLLARNSSKNGIGVYGYAMNMTGNTYGVYGRVDSANGIAGMFMTSASSGNVLVANNAVKRIMRLDTSGNFYVAGTLNQNGADYAEMVAATGDRKSYEPGDVLVIDPDSDRHITLARTPYATNVAGVFSTKPGTLGSNHEMGTYADDELPLAMVGIVPCKVTTENGPIHRGDLLVTSSTPGHAMKATDRSRMVGAILGKAMQSVEGGSATIEIMVSPQ